MYTESTSTNVWIVLAAYNEEKQIGNVLREVKKYARNIVVVDDGSSDKTVEIASNENIEVLKHAVNLGKGAAVKTGCDFAIERGAKYIVLMDSDGQHNALDIPQFLNEVMNNDIVFGWRKQPKNMPVLLRFGNWFLTTSVAVLYGMKLKDTQCGYRALTKEAYGKVRWSSTGYSMESEMIARAGKHKLSYSEVGTDTIYLDKYKGTGPIDGVKIFINMLIWRLGWF